MSTIPISAYLILSLFLFSIGTIGVLIRKNSIVVFMCIELMLNAVNIAFVTFSKLNQNLDGHIAVFFVMVVATAEAAVGLAIIISVFKATESIETSEVSSLHG